MEQFEFQQNAIGELISQFKSLWRQTEHQIPITLKAPTGSGKTYMMEKMICELSNQPDWQQDIAYIWITFSDDLAMQSRDKFTSYFAPNIPGRLLTIADLSKGALQCSDILFLNWQKLVSRAAENRVNRRPADSRNLKEQGYYYEDVIEMTHEDGREIVLIIDESHKNVTTASMRDVINPMNPKIIFKVSATPEHEPSASDVHNKRAGFVEISRKDVVEAGLIKEEIICQTEEDIRQHRDTDLDEALIQMAMDKRMELVNQLNAAGINVNPLVLIQLPNDDNDLITQGEKTKEIIARDYLTDHGVEKERIASWFDSKKKPEGLEDNDSPYDYLLFKVAAGTGWDCPRAQILVMFREIKSPTFHTQTIGRLVRIPVRNSQGSDIFRRGYVYTNYKRNEVVASDDFKTDPNKPKLLIAVRQKDINMGNDIYDELLQSEYISRVDYGDLGRADRLQRSLFLSFNEYFGLGEDDVFDQVTKKMQGKGLVLDPKLVNAIIVNARFKDIDQLNTELMNGTDMEVEVSRNDVEKAFNLMCVQLLREQTEDDAKVTNVARAWSPLKSALRYWLKHTLPTYTDDQCYRIFLKDISKDGGSLFRHALRDALVKYRTTDLKEQLEKRRKAALEMDTKPFKILKTYAFSEDYEAIEMEKCLYKPFFIKKEYIGRKTELPFARYLDSQKNVKWWMKNGDEGKEYLSFRYFDETEQRYSLFYPDWIVKFKNGTTGIFDTKGGQTATSKDTKNKAEELYRRIRILNGYDREGKRYIGGIVINEGNLWYLNNTEMYDYRPGHTEGWKPLNDVFKQQDY